MSTPAPNDFFQQIPLLRPALNVGCLMDIPTSGGSYHTGIHGESILNAGLSHVTGVAGRGNTNKSTLAHFLNLRGLDRHSLTTQLIYDTEGSVSYLRMNSLSEKMERLPMEPLESGRCIITDGLVVMGEEYWDQIQSFGKAKKSSGKSSLGTTPFCVDGKLMKAIMPTLVEVDSMSMMNFTALTKLCDKAKLDSSDMNAEALRSNLIKSRLLMQLPMMASNFNCYTTIVAHMGDDLALDPRSPPAKKLAYLKQKVKFKQVPEKFTFLTNNLWHCASSTPLLHRELKTPFYPRSSADNIKDDPDLQVVRVQNLRAKSGPTGMPFELVVSQSEGVLPSETEYRYLRSTKIVNGNAHKAGYGMFGHDTIQELDILPGVKLGRTTIRPKVNELPELVRALEITSEMAQINTLWKRLEPKYRITPAELYEKIKEKGYDWNELLTTTRGYWVFLEDDHHLNFLSTMDLIKMALGEYHPYWMKK